MLNQHKKIVIVLIALAALGLAGWFLFRKQASPVPLSPREQTREEKIHEILVLPRETPLSEEQKENIQEELTLPRPGGDLTEEEKAEIQEQLQ